MNWIYWLEDSLSLYTPMDLPSDGSLRVTPFLSSPGHTNIVWNDVIHHTNCAWYLPSLYLKHGMTYTCGSHETGQSPQAWRQVVAWCTFTVGNDSLPLLNKTPPPGTTYAYRERINWPYMYTWVVSSLETHERVPYAKNKQNSTTPWNLRISFISYNFTFDEQ